MCLIVDITLTVVFYLEETLGLSRGHQTIVHLLILSLLMVGRAIILLLLRLSLHSLEQLLTLIEKLARSYCLLVSLQHTSDLLTWASSPQLPYGLFVGIRVLQKCSQPSLGASLHAFLLLLFLMLHVFQIGKGSIGLVVLSWGHDAIVHETLV